MKRKFDQLINVQTIKNAKKIKSGNKNWFSPSSLRNCIMDNALIDYLNIYQSANGKGVSDFTKFIMNSGIKFEQVVMQKIGEMFPPHDIKTIYNGHIPNFNETCQKLYIETIKAIEAGYPIIYQGVLINEKEKLYGTPDLIIKGTHINKIYDKQILSNDDSLKLNSYYIMDIKFSTITLLTDLLHIGNDTKTKYYKSQVWIYTNALNIIQENPVNIGFVLNRGWNASITGHGLGSNNCFDRPGVIDYSDNDSEIIDIVKHAIRIKNDIINNGSTFTLDPPSRHYLWPNMCVPDEYNGGWSKVKEELAHKLGEITLLHNCGRAQREIAHDKGIFSLFDPKCSAAALGIKSNQRTLIDRIIATHKSNKLINVYDKQYILNNFKDSLDSVDLYVDFEVANNIVFEDFANIPYSTRKSIVYLIGVGWESYGNQWNYRHFTVDKFTLEDEREMFLNFLKFTKKFSNPRLIHWGHIERTTTTKLFNNHSIFNGDYPLNWYDLNMVFKSGVVLIKDIFKFGLKDIGHALGINWNIDNGDDTLIVIKECYDLSTKNNISLSQIDKYQNTLIYNEMDCKSMWIIIKTIKDNLNK
jgi:hypothetical protein